jgi:two-component system sensor histidine kinase DesK
VNGLVDRPSDKPKTMWWPLVFTPFIAFVFLDPYQRHASPREWTWTGLAVLAFLGLYVYGLTTAFRRQRTPALAALAAISVIGLVMAPFNGGAALFIIYATSFAPYVVGGEIAAAVTVIGTILAAVALESWLLHLSWYFWAYSFGYALILGTGNTYSARQAFSVERIAKADERERIARDLHDVLGHTLSVIVLKAELAGKLLERDPARAKAEIGDVERIAREALAEVRQTISGYLSGGLQAEFERANATLSTAGVAVQCRLATVGITSAQERVLALVLREAVTNVVRHAHAKTCRMQLQEANGACRMEIEDDGGGGPHSEGHGIRGMRERIEAIGGTLSYQGEAGTRLTVTLPLASPAVGQAG